MTKCKQIMKLMLTRGLILLFNILCTRTPGTNYFTAQLWTSVCLVQCFSTCFFITSLSPGVSLDIFSNNHHHAVFI